MLLHVTVNYKHKKNNFLVLKIIMKRSFLFIKEELSL